MDSARIDRHKFPKSHFGVSGVWAGNIIPQIHLALLYTYFNDSLIASHACLSSVISLYLKVSQQFLHSLPQAPSRVYPQLEALYPTIAISTSQQRTHRLWDSIPALGVWERVVDNKHDESPTPKSTEQHFPLSFLRTILPKLKSFTYKPSFPKS